MSRGFMDTSKSFHDGLIRPSCTIASSLKGSSDSLFAQSGGLMRYHSAPSSTLSALLESDFCSANEASELVQFLSQDGLNEFAGYGDLSLKPHHKQPCSIKEGQPQQMYSGQTDVILQQCVQRNVIFEDHIAQGHLSAILEHAGEEGCLPQPCQGNPMANTSTGATSDSNNQYKSNLIRHSSLPTDFLSRLAVEDMSERPMGSQQMGVHVQSSSQGVSSRIQSTIPMNADDTGDKVYVISSRTSSKRLPVRKCLTDDALRCKEEDRGALNSELNQDCGLLRQSSSPAGLLSQLSLDELASPTDDMLTSTQGLILDGWDEASMQMDFALRKIAALGQRKRGREVHAKLIKSLPAVDTLMDQITSSPKNQYSVGASNGDASDSVSCKSRAKRGCATHPRSIAERVRRTKISERIKKLQDLVPNLDKQAHTADMLDEVVEYVKLLQRQVAELSNQSHECNGTCQKKENSSVEM